MRGYRASVLLGNTRFLMLPHTNWLLLRSGQVANYLRAAAAQRLT